eukprot:TRINITY_DN3202_c0_g3_i2.p1 TRINITY_DN3202_c0_g3~~TRINITY_DN3202_c0_g3_i2.p1  ORF type:complete len:114 (-),score=5.34 TRINITY_DN3202_c0_g3_i2:144-485(-)
MLRLLLTSLIWLGRVLIRSKWQRATLKEQMAAGPSGDSATLCRVGELVVAQLATLHKVTSFGSLGYVLQVHPLVHQEVNSPSWLSHETSEPVAPKNPSQILEPDEPPRDPQPS